MARLNVEVVYATRELQEIVTVALDEGACAIDAVRASRLCEGHPELDVRTLRLGVFGSEAGRETIVADGDRVEIYRPLRVDPKEARRAKVRAGSPQRRNRSV